MTRLTFGGAVYSLPDLEPGRPIRRFRVPWQRHLPGSRGWRQPAASADAEQDVSRFRGLSRRMASGWLMSKSQRGRQIWTVPLEDQGGQLKAGKPEQFLKSSFDDQAPAFSPDGRWLAYQSNESGKNEVYVRAFPPPSSGQGGKWQISNSGGTCAALVAERARAGVPVGRPDHGRELHGERRHVRGGEAPGMDRQARRDAVGSGAGRQARGGADACGIRGSAQAGARSGVPR